MKNLDMTKVCMLCLASVYLISAVSYAMGGEGFKAGAMLACGMLFVINLARFTNMEG